MSANAVKYRTIAGQIAVDRFCHPDRRNRSRAMRAAVQRRVRRIIPRRESSRGSNERSSRVIH
jgi:hypothetical protein